MTTDSPITTAEGSTAPRVLETYTCTRCGGSGRMPFSAYGGICFKCNGAKRLYTRRGAAARAFLDRLRSRTTAELKPGMLIFDAGFSCGSVSKPSSWNRITLVDAEPKVRASHGISNGQPVADCLIECDHMHYQCGLQALHRVGHTALGKQQTLKLALDYQDKLTKQGKIAKAWAPFMATPEVILAGTDTSAWLVVKDLSQPAPEDKAGKAFDRSLDADLKQKGWNLNLPIDGKEVK